MNIIVLTKVVPDIERVKFDAAREWWTGVRHRRRSTP